MGTGGCFGAEARPYPRRGAGPLSVPKRSRVNPWTLIVGTRLDSHPYSSRRHDDLENFNPFNTTAELTSANALHLSEVLIAVSGVRSGDEPTNSWQRPEERPICQRRRIRREATHLRQAPLVKPRRERGGRVRKTGRAYLAARGAENVAVV